MLDNTRYIAKQRSVDISVVSALYNEAASADELLRRLDAVFRQLGTTYELIIVDDGSTDDSLNKLKAHVGNIDNLRIVELYRNKGQVAALSAGMTVARGEWVIMLDADLQHDPKTILKFFELSREGYDLVASYREHREETAIRKLITLIGNTVNRYLIGAEIKDFGSAFRMINANILTMLTDSRGYVHYNTPAIYLNAKKQVEIPITQHRREHGSSKWTLLAFIFFNLDFIAASPRLTQILLMLSGIGILSGVALYSLFQIGFFADVSAISAPVSIVFTSFTLAILAVVWREVMEVMKVSKGVPPFFISAIWSDGVAECDDLVVVPAANRTAEN